jgi:hypothetical protein
MTVLALARASNKFEKEEGGVALRSLQYRYMEKSTLRWRPTTTWVRSDARQVKVAKIPRLYGMRCDSERVRWGKTNTGKDGGAAFRSPRQW